MLTDEQINKLADAAGRSGAQKVAAKTALVAAMKVMSTPTLQTGQAPDGTVLASPTAPNIIVVISTARVPSEHYAELLPRLQKAKETFTSFELVTLGNFGSEARAAKWCASNQIMVREFAVVPNLLQPGGDTKNDSRAVERRDDKLRAYLVQAQAVYVIGHGDKTSFDWKRIDGMIRKVEAWFPLERQEPSLREPVPAPAGAPDVEGAVVDADVAAVGYDTEAAFEAAMRELMDS